MAEQAKHMSAPWRVFNFCGFHIGTVKTGEAICSMRRSEEEGEANAAHIVRCVNSHDAMVEALEDARNELWDAHHSHMSEEDFNKQFGNIDAALRLAKGEADA
ncbi:hypothetical protein ACLBWS_05880 [Brucellaceae bacterium D45D]